MDDNTNSLPKVKVVKVATVLPKHTHNIPKTVEQMLEELSKGLSNDMIAWIKEKLESGVHLWIGEKLGEFQIKLVADSSFIISSLEHHLKKNTAILFKLVTNPLFTIYIPKIAEIEVLEYIEKKTKKKQNIEKLRELWKELKPNLKIQEPRDPQAEKIAKEIIGKRDPSDIPFVSLYVDIGATAIITNDNDYNTPSVKKFSIGDLNNIVAVFHRGIFSFFVMNDVLPLVIEGISKIVIAIVKSLYQFLVLIFNICVSTLTGSMQRLSNFLSNIPSKAQAVIMISFTILALFLAFHKGARDKVSGFIKSMWGKVKSFVMIIVNFISNAIGKLIHYAELSGPYVGMSLTILVEIRKHAIAISEEIKNLGLERVAHYS